MVLGDAVTQHPVSAIVTLYGAGVVTSLSPCVYPMLPITVGLLSGTADTTQSRRRVVALALAYVIGLASLYALLGLLAGLTGSLFGTVGSSWWARLTIAAMLAIFGLAMLEVLPVPVPAGLARWAAGLRGGSIAAALLLGATSGIVAAPCGAPAFAAVLTWVATTRSAGWGFVYLFAFSLGMTTLLLAVGLSSGVMTRLPRAGPWMARIHRVGGTLLLVMAAYYVWQAWAVR